ncbi:MAG: amidohydrolase [Halobacteriaceae archaeon]
MTRAADLILENAEVHTLAPQGDRTAEAVAVRDGRVVRVGSRYEVGFLESVETTVMDVGGRVVLPGFVDAHTHLSSVGRYRVHADLRTVDSPAEAVRVLEAHAEETTGWVQGYGFDESTWTTQRYLTRADLDAVSEDRPVLALREDGHTATVNSVALDRLEADLPDEDVKTAGGEPTGVLVEDAVSVAREAVAPDRAETRELVAAAQAVAHERGVTAVHDMVRQSHAPQVYRSMAVADALRLRVRVNYWWDHIDAVTEVGLHPDHGSPWVQTGAIKTFTDGSFGGRTAKVSTPYADGDGTGQWVVDPASLEDRVARVTDAGFQVAIHAIGDEAVAAALDAIAAHGTPEDRHRIEHAELADDAAIDRFVEHGVVASMQPNFLKWGRADGLYETRLGADRAARTNRFGAMADAGVTVALGSDCMPMDPLFGIDQVVTAPHRAQRLNVTEALRGYTHGAAAAGFDEDRMGSVEPGKFGDLVVLEDSPWAVDAIADIDVVATIVGGEVVYDDLRE